MVSGMTWSNPILGPYTLWYLPMTIGMPNLSEYANIAASPYILLRAYVALSLEISFSASGALSSVGTTAYIRLTATAYTSLVDEKNIFLRVFISLACSRRFKVESALT